MYPHPESMINGDVIAFHTIHHFPGGRLGEAQSCS